MCIRDRFDLITFRCMLRLISLHSDVHLCLYLWPFVRPHYNLWTISCIKPPFFVEKNQFVCNLGKIKAFGSFLRFLSEWVGKSYLGNWHLRYWNLGNWHYWWFYLNVREIEFVEKIEVRENEIGEINFRDIEIREIEFGILICNLRM